MAPRHHTDTHVRGCQPLLAVAAGTGEVLMARLREGRANTVRGAAHSLRETIGRVRYAGTRGELTVRADSGFYDLEVGKVCRAMGVRFSITLCQHGSVHRLIEAIPEPAWTPIPYWPDGGADVAETVYTPSADQADPTPCGSPCVPSGRFAANGAWLAVQVLAHNLARWTAPHRPRGTIVTAKTPPLAAVQPPRGADPLGPPAAPPARPLAWPTAVGTVLARPRVIPLVS